MENISVTELIKSRVNIVDIIGRYVELRPISGRWMAPCPFHQETKPSMSVNEQDGFYYCFGCQAAGDVIDFYKRINGIDFRDALEALAAEAGIDLDSFGKSPKSNKNSKDTQDKQIYIAMHEAARIFFRNNLSLPANKIPQEYFDNRGLVREIQETFSLGYSPTDWHALDLFLQSKKYTSEQGVLAGLLSQNEKKQIYDRFRARIIFPIYNLSGSVIAFGGRTITDDGPKYLNSSDSPIYKKGDHLYGLYQARPHIVKTKRAILTEGYMDVLSLHQYGYKNACSVLGTAVTLEQIKRLSGFCSTIALLFDGDAPGRKAALKSSELILSQGVSCTVVLFPEGEDVDSLLQKHGNIALDELLEKAQDGLSFCMKMLRDEYSPKEMLAWCFSFLSKLQDKNLLAFYLPRLSQGLRLSEQELRSGFLKKSADTQNRSTFIPEEKTQQKLVLHRISKEEQNDRRLLECAILYPEYVQELMFRGFETVLVSQWGRKFWQLLLIVGEGDILSSLDEGQKKFYIETKYKFVDKNTELSENTEKIQANAEEEFQLLCYAIDKKKLQERILQVREELSCLVEDREREKELLLEKQTLARELQALEKV